MSDSQSIRSKRGTFVHEAQLASVQLPMLCVKKSASNKNGHIDVAGNCCDRRRQAKPKRSIQTERSHAPPPASLQAHVKYNAREKEIDYIVLAI